MDYNESEILKQVIKHDRAAFNTLYIKYLGHLYRYIYLICKSKEVSEEIVQDVFIKIWERREQLDSIGSFKPYIFRSAKNLLLDHIKKERIKQRTLRLVKQEMFAEDADMQLKCKQYHQIAQMAIRMLPEKRKQIVELRTQEHLSLDEIAFKLSISKSVVKKQLYKGFSFLRKYLQQHGEVAVLLLFIRLLFQL